MSARDAAEKWGVSQRRVSTLCVEQRIKNATMVGNMWLIPKDAEKPEDARTLRYIEEKRASVKPFLKWAGGKSQLISEIEKFYPFSDNITKYAEPFVGGGAVLFDILGKYEVNEVYISDINPVLINTYSVIRQKSEELIFALEKIQNDFLPLSAEERRKFFISKRDRFNEIKTNDSGNYDIETASLMIFLNKTCFNGLYRVNKKGHFNVPSGNYKNPVICDERNLKAVSEKLKNIDIICADYKKSYDFIDSHTFVYLDPPYRPITETASFTAYTEYSFSDAEQIELKKYVDSLNKKGAKILISNSDPKNINEADNFFDDLYATFNIKRVNANRMINSKSNGRGKIKELLISNFEVK